VSIIPFSHPLRKFLVPASNPNEWSATAVRRAISAAGVALWSWNVETDGSMDNRGFELWDLERRDSVGFEDLSARIHPADRDRVRAAFTATRAIVGAYEIDFRLIIGDDIRWVSARGIGDDTAALDNIAYGIFLDVTGRKQAEEGHELLAGEMSHRVKNLLAIASGLTQISSRSTTTAKEMAVELTARLASLGRAHNLVRPLPGHQGKAALLGDLLSVLLSPNEDTGAFSGRIRVAVPRMGVAEGAATTLALVMHELATNSLKYGALSAETGTLDIRVAPRATMSGSCGPSAADRRFTKAPAAQVTAAASSSEASPANSAARSNTIEQRTGSLRHCD
jgi:two-component sensor histidine kinase